MTLSQQAIINRPSRPLAPYLKFRYRKLQELEQYKEKNMMVKDLWDKLTDQEKLKLNQQHDIEEKEYWVKFAKWKQQYGITQSDLKSEKTRKKSIEIDYTKSVKTKGTRQSKTLTNNKTKTRQNGKFARSSKVKKSPRKIHEAQSQKLQIQQQQKVEIKYKQTDQTYEQQIDKYQKNEEQKVQAENIQIDQKKKQKKMKQRRKDDQIKRLLEGHQQVINKKPVSPGTFFHYFREQNINKFKNQLDKQYKIEKLWRDMSSQQKSKWQKQYQQQCKIYMKKYNKWQEKQKQTKLDQKLIKIKKQKTKEQQMRKNPKKNKPCQQFQDSFSQNTEDQFINYQPIKNPQNDQKQQIKSEIIKQEQPQKNILAQNMSQKQIDFPINQSQKQNSYFNIQPQLNLQINPHKITKQQQEIQVDFPINRIQEPNQPLDIKFQINFQINPYRLSQQQQVRQQQQQLSQGNQVIRPIVIPNGNKQVNLNLQIIFKQ